MATLDDAVRGMIREELAALQTAQHAELVGILTGIGQTLVNMDTRLTNLDARITGLEIRMGAVEDVLRDQGHTPIGE